MELFKDRKPIWDKGRRIVERICAEAGFEPDYNSAEAILARIVSNYDPDSIRQLDEDGKNFFNYITQEMRRGLNKIRWLSTLDIWSKSTAVIEEILTKVGMVSDKKTAHNLLTEILLRNDLNNIHKLLEKEFLELVRQSTYHIIGQSSLSVAQHDATPTLHDEM